jgi:Fur family ferric uptake transcriptional regulator
VAKDKGFHLESHTMLLYGICPECAPRHGK